MTLVQPCEVRVEYNDIVIAALGVDVFSFIMLTKLQDAQKYCFPRCMYCEIAKTRFSEAFNL